MLGQALAPGAGRQGRHPPVRRRLDPDGRDAGPGRRRRVRAARTPCTPASRSPCCRFIVGTDTYPMVLNRHVFESLAFHAQIALHVRVLYGRDPHHITEAQFKAVARALRAAVRTATRGCHRACRRRRRASCDRARRSAGSAAIAPVAVARTTGRAICASAGAAPCAAPARRSRSTVRLRRCASGRRRSGGARRRRLRGVHGRVCGGHGRRGSSTAGWPAAGRCWASASACRSCSSAASSTASHRGLRRVAGHGGAAAGADVLPHMGWNTVDAPRRTRCCSPGIDPTTRFYFVHSYARAEWELEAPPFTAAGGDLGRARRPVRRRGGERPAVGDPVPPGEVRRRRRPAAAQLGRESLT